MMCIIFINILSTVSLDIFIGTVKQIVKFISYLTTVTNSTIFFRPLEYLTIVFAGLVVCVTKSKFQYSFGGREPVWPSGKAVGW